MLFENLGHKMCGNQKGIWTESFQTKMPVPATVYVQKRNHSMWELAKNVFKFGTGESNDYAVDDDRGEHPKNLEGMSDVWTSTVPEFYAPAVSFKRPTSLSPSLIATSNSAKSVSHGSTLVAFTSHAKGGLQTKPLKLGTYLSITCA
jgi:hypothetical protein